VKKTVGILALQGDYAAHARVLRELGVRVELIREPRQLAGLDALIMPGGESTTMSLLLDSTGLRGPLRELLAPSENGRRGLPVLATCAGAILLARKLKRDDGSVKVQTLELLDATVERNAYGRQVDSFVATLRIDWEALGVPEADPAFEGVFIRAPLISRPGAAIVPVCRHDGELVVVRQGNMLVATFHPELAGDARLHAALLTWC